MAFKPFKQPLLVRKSADGAATGLPSTRELGENVPFKKRRLSPPDDTTSKASGDLDSKASVNLSTSRKPLNSAENVTREAASRVAGDSLHAIFYAVLWRKFTTKKNKTWDGDGVLVVDEGSARLHDVGGRDLGKGPWSSPLLPGSILSVGSKEVEIAGVITKQEYLRFRPAAASAKPALIDICVKEAPTPKLPANVPSVLSSLFLAQATSAGAPKPSQKGSIISSNRFKNPAHSSTILQRIKGGPPVPKHDPSQPNSLVMKAPERAPPGKQLVDVVVDPILSKHLRDHQREGVKFMYECVMALRPFNGEGAILADEMGLGKTLQTIALLWTLLKQNPVHGETPVVKKALVVCPASLINNWRKEFRKWLGAERIGVFVADGTKTRIRDFTMGKTYNVMIIGYEKLRSVQDDLKKGIGIDIVIADEGHRLKTAQNKAALAIKSLNTAKRIILSGTPIQNDLGEFYTMVDFVNPGLLGKYSSFKRDTENPILRSRQPDATEKDHEKGEACSDELAAITNLFVLRRTADILAKYLPPKTEYVLFCRPTAAQASLYRYVLSSPLFASVMGSSESALQLINVLKKVCNSPTLLKSRSSDEAVSQTISDLIADMPPALTQSPGASGKIQVLDSLLHRLRMSKNSEKVVIVSNYTATLDILANLLTSLSYPHLRLDGSTPVAKRQPLVDRFNRADSKSCFAFLLSAKAGGLGLNLIGASRLVLFDVDWNPSVDAQAMARIHRDGQTKPCMIYRLLTLGALDEKIFQRQATKIGLADSVLDSKAGASSFTRDELRDLFTLDSSGKCMTHQLLACPCPADGSAPPPTAAISTEHDNGGDDDDDEDLPELPVVLRASEVNMVEQEQRRRTLAQAKRKSARGGGRDALMRYAHLDVTALARDDAPELVLDDEILRGVLTERGNRVSFVFSKTAA